MAADVLTAKTGSQKGGKPGRENRNAPPSASESKGAARTADTKARSEVKAAAEKQKKATPFPAETIDCFVQQRGGDAGCSDSIAKSAGVLQRTRQ